MSISGHRPEAYRSYARRQFQPNLLTIYGRAVLSDTISQDVANNFNTQQHERLRLLDTASSAHALVYLSAPRLVPSNLSGSRLGSRRSRGMLVEEIEGCVLTEPTIPQSIFQAGVFSVRSLHARMASPVASMDYPNPLEIFRVWANGEDTYAPEIAAVHEALIPPAKRPKLLSGIDSIIIGTIHVPGGTMTEEEISETVAPIFESIPHEILLSSVALQSLTRLSTHKDIVSPTQA